MSMHLVNKQQEEFGFSLMSWYKVLSLAYTCGWVPAGTLPPIDEDDDEEWNGRYHIGEGQWITAEDARGLAAALDASMDDIPDIDLCRPMRKPIRFGEFEFYVNEEEHIEQMTVRFEQIPFEYFSGARRKKRLREFSAFCKRGGFTIW